jgi:Phosphotransferase enzyme family
MIGLDDAASYLRQIGLITTASVIDGDLIVKGMTRRNRNLAVSRSDGPGYLVKQPEDAVAARTLQREAAFYQLCQTEPAAAEFVAQLPRYAFFDSSRSVLGLELVEPAQSLWTYHYKFAAKDFPLDAAGELGRCLGNLHRAFRGRVDEPALAWLAGDPPWIMQVHEPTLEHLATITAANYKFLQIIQAQPGLSVRLAKLCPQWRRETLIHGDVKSENILVTSETAAAADTASGSDALQSLRLVDWELVQSGDPAWDIAGLLQDFIVFWVMSMPAADTIPAMAAQARYPLDILKPAINAFWKSYRETATLGSAESNALILRAVQFSAARLLQSAFEFGSGFGHALPQPAVLLLQIGKNLLDDPAAGQVQLYGIRHAL